MSNTVKQESVIDLLSSGDEAHPCSIVRAATFPSTVVLYSDSESMTNAADERET